MRPEFPRRSAAIGLSRRRCPTGRTSESPDSGDGMDEIAVDYGGPNITIGFNAKYFLDVLGSLDDEEVTLGLSGELDPAVLRPGNASDKPGDKQFLAVVMPMRI